MGTQQQNQHQQAQLPSLQETERLTPGCIRILGGNPSKFTLQGTNTYLLGTGSSRILIDTGEGRPAWLAALRRVLRDEGASVAQALITHRHHDHTGGIADLVAAWPGTLVYKHQPEAAAETAAPGLLDIADGQRFHAEGVTLTAVHTPGHTEDHMVFFWEEQNALFTGDNVLGHGTSVFEDLGLYVASLEKMRGLYSSEAGNEAKRGKTPVAYPGHGAVINDGPARIEEYIRHRAQREEQVLQVLRGGNADAAAVAGNGSGAGKGKGDGWTVMELVQNIYRDVPESLHLAAAGGVVQNLQKLEREGRVVALGDGERWRLVSSSGRSAL